MKIKKNIILYSIFFLFFSQKVFSSITSFNDASKFNFEELQKSNFKNTFNINEKNLPPNSKEKNFLPSLNSMLNLFPNSLMNPEINFSLESLSNPFIFVNYDSLTEDIKNILNKIILYIKDIKLTIKEEITNPKKLWMYITTQNLNTESEEAFKEAEENLFWGEKLEEFINKIKTKREELSSKIDFKKNIVDFSYNPKITDFLNIENFLLNLQLNQYSLMLLYKVSKLDEIDSLKNEINEENKETINKKIENIEESIDNLDNQNPLIAKDALLSSLFFMPKKKSADDIEFLIKSSLFNNNKKLDIKKIASILKNFINYIYSLEDYERLSYILSLCNIKKFSEKSLSSEDFFIKIRDKFKTEIHFDILINEEVNKKIASINTLLIDTSFNKENFNKNIKIILKNNENNAENFINTFETKLNEIKKKTSSELEKIVTKKNYTDFIEKIKKIKEIYTKENCIIYKKNNTEKNLSTLLEEENSDFFEFLFMIFFNFTEEDIQKIYKIDENKTLSFNNIFNKIRKQSIITGIEKIQNKNKDNFSSKSKKKNSSTLEEDNEIYNKDFFSLLNSFYKKKIEPLENIKKLLEEKNSLWDTLNSIYSITKITKDLNLELKKEDPKNEELLKEIFKNDFTNSFRSILTPFEEEYEKFKEKIEIIIKNAEKTKAEIDLSTDDALKKINERKEYGEEIEKKINLHITELEELQGAYKELENIEDDSKDIENITNLINLKIKDKTISDKINSILKESSKEDNPQKYIKKEISQIAEEKKSSISEYKKKIEEIANQKKEILNNKEKINIIKNIEGKKKKLEESKNEKELKQKKLEEWNEKNIEDEEQINLIKKEKEEKEITIKSDLELIKKNSIENEILENEKNKIELLIDEDSEKLDFKKKIIEENITKNAIESYKIELEKKKLTKDITKEENEIFEYKDKINSLEDSTNFLNNAKVVDFDSISDVISKYLEGKNKIFNSTENIKEYIKEIDSLKVKK